MDVEPQKAIDERYMRRCLQLARNGRQHAKPNPMVGAVILSADGRIIGEGYHLCCGGAHAEVNAFASVRPEDERLLPGATVYVSLEPCSHWGKTPPCADLIVKKGVCRVVCGCIDPFAEVRGRGVRRIREAGIEVTVGVLEQECLALNRRFITVNTRRRPYILLKWAQTANGFMAAAGGRPLAVSTPFTRQLVHRLRADCDAILVGRGTLEADRPRLDVRHWSGPAPRRMVLTHQPDGVPEGFEACAGIDEALQQLYNDRCQSLLVEGGARTLQAFIDRGLWDEIRVETAPWVIDGSVPAPRVPAQARLADVQTIDGNRICRYERPDKG